MRVLLLVALAACLALVSGAPSNQQGALCPSLPVQLELRTSPTLKNKFQLVFASVDPTQRHQQAEFVDIHYRVNNEDSVNLRVMTQDSITEQNMPAKAAQIDGITLLPGDALRAYATYSAKGYACDTPIHTFNAPEFLESDFENERVMNINSRNTRNMRNIASRRVGINSRNDIDQFWSQAAAEEAGVLENQVCPSIAMDQDIVKIQGLDNTYMLTFENRNPAKQLHYVDLHLSTDAENGWDNLRLASDMQLNLAHKVMQPGVVIKPHEVLKWYWSYRTTAADGQVIDCTTPISQISPREITHEITLAELNKAARS